MKFWEAENTPISARAAIHECRLCDVHAAIRDTDGALIDQETGDIIAIKHDEGGFDGGEILTWLGY